MPVFLKPNDISSFSIAANIHQNGGKVRVLDECQFNIDFKGITTHANVIKGSSNYISLKFEDIVTPKAKYFNKIELLDLINKHTLSFLPCASTSIRESDKDGQFILTVRSDIPCDCGLIFEHFLFHVYRFATFTAELIARLQRSGFSVFAQEFIVLLNAQESINENRSEVNSNETGTDSEFESIKQGFIHQRNIKMSLADPTLRKEMSEASSEWVDKWATRQAMKKINLVKQAKQEAEQQQAEYKQRELLRSVQAGETSKAGSPRGRYGSADWGDYDIRNEQDNYHADVMDDAGAEMGNDGDDYGDVDDY